MHSFNRSGKASMGAIELPKSFDSIAMLATPSVN
jgi:hypothetical protein